MQAKAMMKNCIAAALLCAVLHLPAQSDGKQKAASGGDSSKSADKAGASASGAGSAPALCTAEPGSSPAEAGGKSGSGKEGGSATASEAGQTPAVQVTVTTAGAAGAKQAGKPQTGGSKPAAVQVETLRLPDGMTNAAQIAPQLSSLSANVASARAISPSEIVVVLNTTAKPAPAPSPGKPGKKTAAKTQSAHNAPAPKTAGTKGDTADTTALLQNFINHAAQPDPSVFAIQLPAGAGNACGVAHALVNAVPGIASITAVGDTRLLVTASQEQGPVSPELVALVGSQLAPKVHTELEALRRQPTGTVDTTQLSGVLQAWKPVAANRQAAGVSELAAAVLAPNPSLDDRKRLVSALESADEPLETRVKRLAATLATPREPAAAKVGARVQRLYYLHDPESVATLINGIYPDVHAQALPPDAVVLSESEAGGGNALGDAERTITQLDQPHPQVSVDAWSLQLATDNPDSLSNVIPQLEDIAGAYNEALDASIGAGWSYLSGKLGEPGALDPLLREYLTYTTRVSSDGSVQRWEKPYSSPAIPPAKASARPAEYGLGFATLYYPLTPSLLDMLVTLASMSRPQDVAQELLKRMEGPAKRDHNEPAPMDSQGKNGVPRKASCRERDGLYYGIKKANGVRSVEAGHPANLQLECLYEALVGTGGVFAASPTAQATSSLGQLRGALADFLFHYKLEVEYADEFHFYLEPMAADTLDSAFQPIIDAFDEDLSVFQDRLQLEISDTLKEDKSIKYGYGGLVSVKVLGSREGAVRTSTQNYFDTTATPSLGDLFSKLQAGSGSSASLLTTSLTPAAAAQLAMALGQALTPKPTTAHLGRGLDLEVTAHTLSGASGAELDLSVRSTENGAGVVQADGTKTDDLNSRVSQHTVDTHVRLDSMRLFKVSTLGSTLARGQGPWKPFDPYIQIPLLGELFARPRPPKEIYTQSLVFVDAVVVPTAADLGFGVPVIYDEMELEAGRYKKLTRFEDFPSHLGDRILQYHQQVVDCLNREYINSQGSVSSWADGREQAACDLGNFNLKQSDAVN
jgi:hypothetical protein